MECAGYTETQVLKVLREKKGFQFKCKKTQVQKWIEERIGKTTVPQVKTISKRGRGVNDQR